MLVVDGNGVPPAPSISRAEVGLAQETLERVPRRSREGRRKWADEYKKMAGGEDLRPARQLQEAGHDVRSLLHPGLHHRLLEGTFEMTSAAAAVEYVLTSIGKAEVPEEP